MKLPLYKALAEELQEEILSGRYDVGSQLPPELELCQTYSVSRHTMRDALRLLREAGLVERRRGAGTTILARDPQPAYVQPAHTLLDVLQYRQAASFRVLDYQYRALTLAELDRLGLTEVDDWCVVEVVGASETRPLSMGLLYFNKRYASVMPQVQGWDRAILELITENFPVEVQSIVQDITVEVMNEKVAGLLETEVGAAAFVTLRRYYDADNQLFMATDTLMPGSHFAYSMTYQSNKPAQMGFK